MDRMACVDLPELPLQLLLGRHPEWARLPAAVVDQDRPQGVVLWVNDRARSSGILPGMRYASALALTATLRAAEVPKADIEAAVAMLTERLRYFTPNVEPSTAEPGVFWLDAKGLDRLHGSLTRWASLIRADLKARGFEISLVVGFSRFGTYAVARTRHGALVLQDVEEERALARQVPLDILSMHAESRALLKKLGIKTLGEFIDLPADGTARRFPPEVLRLHRLASGDLALPFQPEQPREPAVRTLVLDDAETDLARLVEIAQQLLTPILDRIAENGESVTELRLTLFFDCGGSRAETLRPAEPTRDAKQLLDLVHLRLNGILPLPDGIIKIVLEADATARKPEQLSLFEEKPRRDFGAANRALALVRAELGDAAVRRVALRDGHLPEGTFTLEPLDRLKAPSPPRIDEGLLVRRFYPKPVPLLSAPRHNPDVWMLRGVGRGRAINHVGPHILAGGWWRRRVHREYYYVMTDRGEILWVFFDAVERRWFLHGRVE